MVGLVGVGAGRTGAFNALNGLRGIGRALHAWVIPDQVSIAEARKEFDENGGIRDPELETRIKGVGRNVARFSYLHTSEKALEFLRLWEEAPENPGGD